ncbi:hypothetical protein EC968_006121 [Mortierella alpina]|nr:hypothetical protein EC968_006121 [Mortierella alpina]
MCDTQSFRVAGTTTDIKIIDVDNVNGQNVIFWEDIEQVFPGVGHLCKGSTVVKLLRDSHQIRLVPHCIKHYPGVILEVFLRTTAECDPADSRKAASSLVVTTGQVCTLSTGPFTDLARKVDTLPYDLADDQSDATIDATFAKTAITDSSADIPATPEDYVVQSLRVTSSSGEAPTSDSLISTMSAATLMTSEAALSSQEMIRLASNMARTLDGHGHLQEFNKNMVSLVGLDTVDTKLVDFFDKQEELVQRQEQHLAWQEEKRQQLLLTHSLNESAVLQNRVQALLAQTYEPHEDPLPRLFIVLPQDSSAWDAANPLSNKFRLHFMCECGDHTKSLSRGINITNHIHLSLHEGYEIRSNPEFFHQWGHYFLTIMKMLKHGVSVAGIAVLDAAHLVIEDFYKKGSVCPNSLEIEHGIDLVIECMDNFLLEDSEGLEGIIRQVDSNITLDDVDLRQLHTFLEGPDESKILGNLHRVFTDGGHIKWVCLNHYNARYPEIAVNELRHVLDSSGGSLDIEKNVVQVKLGSTARAREFYSALTNAKFVLELDIALDWACTASDLQALEDALKESSVSILRLDLRRTILSSEFLAKFAQQGVILRIEELSNMKMIHVVLSPQLTSAQRRMTHSFENK